jgi:hypothetical protein
MATNGIRNVPRSGDPNALPDSVVWQAIDLLIAVVESLADYVPAARRATARRLALLELFTSSRGPDAPIRSGHQSKERRRADATQES